jgi:hypothetical protein
MGILGDKISGGYQTLGLSPSWYDGCITAFDLPILGNITLRDKMIVKKWLSALILFGGIEKK